MIKLITNNFGYKVLAVAISTTLWLVLVDEPESATSHSAPVQFRNVPKDLEIASDVKDRVRLDLRGPSGKLTSASLAETVVRLDLTPVNRAGAYTFPIGASTATLPSGVQLERAVPAQIQLFFEKRSARSVPVKIRIGIPPPDGFEIASEKVDPETLRIMGPESHVENITSVETDPIDLNAGQEEDNRAVHAYISDPYVRFESDSRVSVRIQLRKK